MTKLTCKFLPHIKALKNYARTHDNQWEAIKSACALADAHIELGEDAPCQWLEKFIEAPCEIINIEKYIESIGAKAIFNTI